MFVTERDWRHECCPGNNKVDVIVNFNHRKWSIHISNKILCDGDLSKTDPKITLDSL